MAITASLLLTACGFHLKGTEELGAFNFEAVTLAASNGTNADLFNRFERTLTSQGLNDNLSKNSQKAAIEIKLGKTDFKAVKTSAGELGQTTSQLLRMSQAYEILDAQTGKVLVADRVQTLRDRRINPAAILAAERESRSIRETMQNDLIGQILRRVQNLNAQSLNTQSLNKDATEPK